MLYLCNVITRIGEDVNEAISLLKAGEIVAIPTETVYGLAGLATDENAIQNIFKVKQRPSSNPLILHVDSLEKIQPYVSEFPMIFKQLANEFCPGPLTFLMPKSGLVSDLITAGNARVAVRIPNHPITLRMLQLLGKPVAAPSANLYGKLSPTLASHVLEQLGGKIPYILDGKECAKGIESTIIGIEKNEVVIYRLGSITPEDLSRQLGYLPGLKIHADELPTASGMVKYHYAPATSCSYYHSSLPFDATAGYLMFNEKYPEKSDENISYLSRGGDLEEAAKNLYALLHEMDGKGYSHIFIEKLPEQGIGIAINDRLNRAVAKYNK